MNLFPITYIEKRIFYKKRDLIDWCGYSLPKLAKKSNKVIEPTNTMIGSLKKL